MEIAPRHHLLSVTTASTGDVVTMHADKEGLCRLRDQLNTLIAALETGEADHAHLRSTAWAGFELTTTMLASERDSGHQTVHHLEIFAWNAQWRRRHGL